VDQELEGDEELALYQLSTCIFPVEQKVYVFVCEEARK